MKKRIYILLLFYCLAMADTASGLCEIRLHRQADVAPGSVCLADISEIRAQDSDQASRLESLVIAQYPQAVTGVSIRVFDICRALAQVNVNPAAVNIYGASSCRLIFSDAVPAEAVPTLACRPTDEIDAPAESQGYQTLADQLTEAVVRLSGLDAGKLKVEWNCTRPNILEQKADKHRFVITPHSTSTLGDVRFEVVDQGVPGKQQRLSSGSIGSTNRIRVHGHVEYLCQSVVARRCLKPGEVIRQTDVELAPRRVTSYRDIGVSDLDSVLGQEVARTITGRGLVLPSMIRKLQLVKRNQLVDVYSRVGSVEVKVTGKALANGAYGDMISVSFGTKKNIIQGKVTGPAEVTITQRRYKDSESVVSAVDQNRFRTYMRREKP